MRIFNNKLCAAIITFCLYSSSQLIAGELENLIELKKTALQELVALEATGIGEQHPQIVAKEKQILEIEDKIITCKDSHEEIVILLEGSSSVYMNGHPKFEKSENALPTLLLSGWKIKSVIPAGDKQAYVWLTRE